MNTTPTHTSALVVIDLQVGVVDGGWDYQGVLHRTNTLIERARAEHVPVVFVQHEEEEMPRGSDLWQLSPPLDPLP
ncbi:MAG TPA: isochorismatase family protein, partial [Glaciihabitans sp.]|nr:isochorismatase family protein [Glaciihabitans sp.]